MNEIFASLEAVFLKFSLKRLLFLAFMLALLIISLYSFESMSGYLYLGATEKKITLLKELHALSKDGVASNPDLAPIYKNMADALSNHKIVPMASYTPRWPTAITAGSNTALQALAGMPIGLLLLAMAVREYFRRKQSWTIPGSVGMLLTAGGALLSLLLPQNLTILARAIICFALITVVLASVIAYGAAVRRSPPSINNK